MTTLPQTNQVRLPRPPGMLPGPPQNGNGMGIGPSGTAAGHSAIPNMTPGDAWRVLRGNLWLIFAFVFASAIAGYSVNDYLARYHSRFTAHGKVVIQAPTVYDPQARTTVTLGDYPGLVIDQRTQALLLHDDSLFTRVLQNPSSAIRQTGWYHSFLIPVTDATGTITTVFDSVAAKASLAESFSAVPVESTNLIDVSMTYSKPRDAREIVDAIVEEHLKMQADSVTQLQVQKSQVLIEGRDRKTARIRELQDGIHQRASELNIDSSGLSGSMGFNTHESDLTHLTSQRLTLETELLQLKTRRDKVTAEVNSGEEVDGVEAAVNQDPDVKRYKDDIDDLDVRIRAAVQEKTDNPSIKGLQATLDVYQQKLQEASAAARVTARDGIVNELESASVIAQQQLDSTIKQIQAIHEDVSEKSTAMTEYHALSDELTQAQADLDRTNADIEALNTQIQQTANGVQWESHPTTPDTPSFPILYKSMLVSVLFGFAMSIGIAFLREMTDTTVRSPRDITRVGSLTLLGMIPHEDDDPQSAGVPLPMVIFQAPTSIMAEGFRQVRTRLQHAASLDITRSILVTSPSPGDGKSLVASNLAAGLALNGRRILLVDSNFRKPALDKSFGVSNELGFADVLTSLDRFDSAVHKTQVPNLDLMPAGPRPTNPTELLESQMLLDFIERSLEEYDHVIFDTGPMLLVSETAALAPRVDGVITVVRARTNSRGLLQRMRDNLRALKAEHLGVVLNAVRSQGGGYYGRNIKTYYEYQTASAN